MIRGLDVVNEATKISRDESLRVCPESEQLEFILAMSYQ